MRKAPFFLVLLFMIASLLFASGEKVKLLTIPEKTNFKETSRYSDVIDFLTNLKEKSDLVTVTFFATSHEGKRIPLVILSRPKITEPIEALSLGKRPVLIVADIHPGEVCAKEASLMLMRDIALGDLSYLLDKLVVLVVPILNPDGNDRISKKNRPRQKGPEGGVGVRPNALNFDLNRDFVKLDSNEIRGLVSQVITKWRPLITLNGHTTDGSPHRGDLGCAPPLNPNTYHKIFDYEMEKLLPYVKQELKKKYGFEIYMYGNFRDRYHPEKGWYTYSPVPHFDTNYVGMHNLMAILAETYAYIPYRRRIEVTRRFDEAVIKFIYDHLNEVENIEKEAFEKTIKWGKNPASSPEIVLKAKIAPLKEPIVIKGWKIEERIDEKTGKKTYAITKIPVDYRIPFYGKFVPSKKVKRPYAYLLFPYEKDIVAKLLLHGIKVERLLKPMELEVEGYLVKKVESWGRIYQGHHPTRVEVEPVKLKKMFPKGTYVIPMAQEGANLASYLLEPESDDGFLFWNFFDSELVSEFSGRPRGEFPVYRILSPILLPSSLVKGHFFCDIP